MPGCGLADSCRTRSARACQPLPAGSDRLCQGSGESAEASATAEDPAAPEFTDVGSGTLDAGRLPACPAASVAAARQAMNALKARIVMRSAASGLGRHCGDQRLDVAECEREP